MIACRHEQSEPEEELAAVGLTAPAEEGDEFRKQHGEGGGRQGALRRDPPARPTTGSLRLAAKSNTATPTHSIDELAASGYQESQYLRTGCVF